MELYILQRYAIAGYDENQGFVVQANSYVEARKVAADRARDEGREVWLNPKYSSCKKLKVSGPNAAVIMSDFNSAG